MGTYVLLLRGVNVGKSIRVKMSELRNNLEMSGFVHVVTYINSGNALFDSELNPVEARSVLSGMLGERFSPEIRFALLDARDLVEESMGLPSWWHQDLARRDVLFYTDEVDRPRMRERILAMPLGNEVVHFGATAVFWGKYDERDFLKTAYHKHLIKEPFYKQVTIRNGNTFDKLVELAGKRV